MSDGIFCKFLKYLVIKNNCNFLFVIYYGNNDSCKYSDADFNHLHVAIPTTR